MAPESNLIDLPLILPLNLPLITISSALRVPSIEDSGPKITFSPFILPLIRPSICNSPLHVIEPLRLKLLAKIELEKEGYKIGIANILWIKPFSIKKDWEQAVIKSKFGGIVLDDDYTDGVASSLAYRLIKKTKKNPKKRITPQNACVSSHGLKTNDVLFYMPPVYDTTIGGLNKFDRYYVVKINDNAISLTQSYNGAAITFSSAGTSYFGTHSLHLAYEIKQNYYPSYNSFSYHRTRYAYNGTGSGWDLNGTPLGEVSGQTVWYIPFSNTSPYHYSWQNYYTSGYVYAPWQSSNFNFITSGGVNEPNRYNIFEDWTRFSNNSHRSYTVRSGTSIRTQKYYYSNPYNYYWSTSCLLYTSPSPRDKRQSRMPSSA